MEDVPVGEVVVYLSRRTLDEELAARARRELARVIALAVIPCIALALLVWQFATRRAGHGAQTPHASPSPRDTSRAAPQESTSTPPLQLPQDWDSEDARRAYLKACRTFLRDQHAAAPRLCRLAALENWAELREAAHALREAALALNALPLADAALSVQDAALANTASAARRVEHCLPALTGVLDMVEQVVRDNAEAART
jgi:HPt (histidine-containing phosphotransfer) domain-containing protein